MTPVVLGRESFISEWLSVGPREGAGHPVCRSLRLSIFRYLRDVIFFFFFLKKPEGMVISSVRRINRTATRKLDINGGRGSSKGEPE